MNSLIAHRFLVGEGLNEPERQEVLRLARRLRAMALAGHPIAPLAGRHVAIVAKSDSPAVQIVEEAAGLLGARVSHIDRLALDNGRTRATLARLLASLYDAVDCTDAPDGSALALERLCDLPTFLGLGGERHPIRELLPALNDESATHAPSERADLVSLIQAVLVECIC